MGRITSGIGLASGLDINSIVNQLIAVESRPITQLNTRIESDRSRQTALVGLSASLLSVQLTAGNLAKPSLFAGRSAASSNPGVLTATASSGAAQGTYVVRPVRQAGTHQLLSSGFADAGTTPVGAGTIRVKLGGYVDRSTPLDVLNGGLGVARGQIRITDRSGASTVVDLTGARSIDDVLTVINSAGGIQVQASASGDRLILTDQTGQSAVNLQVAEVAGGSTAAGLGLLGSVASSTLDGQDVVKLAGGLRLAALNDGNGVRQLSGGDFRITRKDGVTIDVDLGTATTLQDVLNLINNDAENTGGAVVASIDADGDRLLLTDSSGGPGTLSVTALGNNRAAADLGILGDEQGGGVLSGKRILPGLNTVLLSDLRGGSVAVTAGSVQFTRAGGGTVAVDLSSAETLADVVDKINASAAGIGISAALNAARDGIVISDATNTNSALTITDNTGNLAASLNITAAAVAGRVNSGDLSLRYVSENTRLASLNGGQGVPAGKFKITNSNGASADIDLTGAGIQTVGDVIAAINAAVIGVTASVNSTGDGILLTDTASGSGTLTVSELTGTTAAGLRLLGSGSAQIDGAYRYDVTIDADDTLNDVVGKLAASGAPLTASVLNAGTPTQSFRLFIASTRSGEAGRLLIDTGATGIVLSTLTDGADAVLEVGAGGPGSLLFTSSNNTFSGVLPGLSLTVAGSSAAPITITIGQDTGNIGDSLQQFVDTFNKTISSLESLTSYDPLTGARGALQADVAVRQIRDKLFDMIASSSGSATGTIRGFAQLGVTISDGQLKIDTDVLQSRLSTDLAGVQQFLADATSGAGKRVESTLKSYTDSLDGTLTRRVDDFDQRIAEMDDRVKFLNERLEARRQRLLDQFAEMERILSQIQSQNTALTQLASIATQFSASNK